MRPGSLLTVKPRILLLISVLLFVSCGIQQNNTDLTNLDKYFENLKNGLEISLVVHTADGTELYHRNGNKKIPSASVIKIPILIELFRMAERGEVSLDQTYTLHKDDIVGGSGELQFEPEGRVVTMEYLAREMIRVSDNTATNVIIRSVGIEQVNTLIRQSNMEQTSLNRFMMDFAAIEQGKQNYTSPADMNRMLLMLLNGDLLSVESREQALEILAGCDDDALIKSRLPQSVKVAHKTGILDYVRADAGIIFSQKPYVLSIFVENFDKVEEAEAAAGEISRIVFDAMNR